VLPRFVLVHHIIECITQFGLRRSTRARPARKIL
jgi:hypothetical protein